MMTGLEKTQSQFFKFLTGQSDSLDLLVVPAGKLSAEDAAQVYRDAYESRLYDAISTNYKPIELLLNSAWKDNVINKLKDESTEGAWTSSGEDSFFEIFSDFFIEAPSREWSLNYYSESFIDYLAQNRALMDEFPFIADLARLSWSKVLVHKMPEVQGLGSHEFSNLGLCEDSRLIFSHGILFLQLNYAVDQIWERLLNGESYQDLLEVYPRFCILGRLAGPASELIFGEFSPIVAPFVMALSEGKSFSEALDLAPDINSTMVQELFAFFAGNRLILKIS